MLLPNHFFPVSFFCIGSLLAACSVPGEADSLASSGSLPEAGSLPQEEGGTVEGAAVDGGVCAFGQVTCDGTTQRTCDGKGGFSSHIECAPNSCADGLGCVVCSPGVGSCTPGVGGVGMAEVCDSMGQKKLRFACDEKQGMRCESDGCHGVCSPLELGANNVGCDYWPTVTANNISSLWFHFGVTVASTSPSADTQILVTSGQDIVQQLTVAPGQAQVVPLSWVPSLKGPDWDKLVNLVPPSASVRSPHGAYRLRSDRPVVVYQLSALEAKVDFFLGCPNPISLFGCYSYSNDGSLLLPSNALSTDYVVAGYRSLPATSRTAGLGDFIAITATQNGTRLHVVPNSNILGGVTLPPIKAGTIGSIDLDAGDVAELFSEGSSANDSLSGTVISASDPTDTMHPIQVISGLACVSIPDDNSSCQHIEETVLPRETLGADYIVSVPFSASGMAGMAQTVRIQAIADDTSLTFDPPSIHNAIMLRPTPAGATAQVLELSNVPSDFRVSSTKEFAVTQYMHSRTSSGESGGPNESVVVPTRQFRSSYTFVAPTTYDTNLVNIIAPTALEVKLDGMVISSGLFTAVGASGQSVAHKIVDSSNGSVHHIEASKPFGIVVYGFSKSASYMYPGGLDLKPVTPPVPR